MKASIQLMKADQSYILLQRLGAPQRYSGPCS